ncbi:MAG: cyclic nucleotide-binding domain-containing protein, partial [Candidatus Marinimicrobia bacterium]|nr:cyclic nucleotide-binding domain-containing protein [Candidatus Neomarinimicrobiota bacterium]
MKLSSILNTLQGQEIFKNLSQEEFNYIFEISEIKNFEKEEYLFHQSMPREAMYVILEGRLAILQGIGDQSTQKAVYKKGSLISERILRSDHSPHATSGQALTTLTVLEITNYALNLMEKFNKPLQEKLVHNAFENYSERMSFKGIKNGSGADSDYRVEHDLLGDRQVPMDALYGVQTLRALENFPITNEHIGVYPSLIRALAMVKKACALSNRDLKLLDEDIAKVIIQACDEIIDGAHSEHFVVDVMQGGAGTSTNMNANEVICNRALELMGKKRGEYKFIHPNNHVNLSQSTNDVYPTALRIALRFAVKRLQASMKQLSKHFSKKALEFKSVIKMGRTQLQDAVPMTLGQEFEAFALMIMEDYERLDESKPLLEEINMGATAIGTGLNADPRYARMVRQYLEEVAGMEMKTAHNLV